MEEKRRDAEVQQFVVMIDEFYNWYSREMISSDFFTKEEVNIILPAISAFAHHFNSYYHNKRFMFGSDYVMDEVMQIINEYSEMPEVDWRANIIQLLKEKGY